VCSMCRRCWRVGPVRRVRWGSGRHHETIFQLFAPLTTHTCFWHLLNHLAPFFARFFTFFSFLTRNYHFSDFFFCSAAYCDRVLLPAAPLRRGGTRGTPSYFLNRRNQLHKILVWDRCWSTCVIIITQDIIFCLAAALELHFFF
jgi:hypothetical protein